MMFPPGDADFSEDRLKEVDKVLELIKDLSSKDFNISEDAVKRADEYLNKGKTGFSKTLINKSESNSENMGKSTDIASFMDAVEKDASERAKRRARQRARANKLKERANTYFKAGDWHRAIDLYTQAIEVCKDWEVLYTNRAQAYLRSGEPAAALNDCDTALSLLSFHRSGSTSKSDHGDSIQPDPLVAKTHFHRGKALMALERPDEALCAYSQSRVYSSGSSSSQQKWPAYLMEYVAQAETAVAAKQVDAVAESDFEARVIRSESINNGPDSILAGTQLVCLLAKLARADQDSTYYSVGLRQLTRLFSSAPRVAQPPLESVEHAVPQQILLTGERQHHSNTTQSPESKDVPIKSALTEQSQETLSDLQTLFRVKKGFSLLNKEVAAIRRSLNMPTHSEDKRQPVTMHSSLAECAPASVACTDRLLALLNLTNLLTIDCGENQRILVEQHPQLIDLGLKCVALAPDFCCLLVEPVVPQSNDGILRQSSINQLSRHKLESLREASSNLLVTLTSSPSGRQALLNAVGSSPLLDSLALCLAESFGQPPLNSDSRCKPNSSVRDAKGVVVSSSATSAICAAKAAQILENLTQSSGFLLSARSSVASLESLLSVIEAALSVSGRAGRSITTTARCLADLLDGLSAACHDATLRTNLLQRRQPLLVSLAECLLRHAPLSTDSGHALLVSSACRLLHNIFVGSLNQIRGTQSLSTCLNSGGLVDTLLAGVGAVLDQPGHGPELRAVAIALAGRLLPLCSGQRILSWLGEPDSITEKFPSDTNGLRTPTERSRLLLAILDSCSLPTCKDKPSHSTDSPTREAWSTETADYHEQNQLSANMLGGCIRCLAAATTHSVVMRYMIGDDRRRARRLARIIRARMPAATDRPPKTTNILSNPTVPRDECLAGNACLILQHCCDDTPLAEHLQGTSVILDLLQLIQESRQLETKRNAAIVVGKLAQASHAHRDELSRLDGWSVLTPFNSWSSSLGRM